MAIKRPDIYEHNNVNLAISDTDFHRGGFRSAVASVSDLYALSGKTGYESAPGQLKEYSTIVYVTGETKYYVLVDVDNVGNANGWEVFTTSSSGLTDVQNVGTGVGVYSGTSGTTALLRSIVGSGDTTVSLSGDSIVVYSNTGSTTLNDGVWRFDQTQQTYLPYTGITVPPSNIIYYTGTSCPCPTGNTRMALNARLTVTELRLSTGRTNVDLVPHLPGDLYWDDNDQTVTLHQTEEVKQQIGQELFVYARNSGATQIDNGSVVYISGSISGRPTIALSRGSSVDGAIIQETIGIVTEDIPAGQNGFVTTSGLVRDINTTGFTEGDIVYLSTTDYGGLTNIKPDYPDFAIEMGIVATSDAVNGSIYVRISDQTVKQTLRGVETASSTNYTATTRSDFIGAYANRNIWLPADPQLGQTITIADGNGDASLFDITICGNGKNISGTNYLTPETEALINTDWGSITMVYNGTFWSIVGSTG